MTTNEYDILIVGAGASGLMAAKQLSSNGKKVIVLEARPRAGGRINTIFEAPFVQPVEGGAEFIHGNLPVTLQLLQEANLLYTKTSGKMLRNSNGKWQEEEQIEGWDTLLDAMNELPEDATLTQFLATYFTGEKYKLLRQTAIQYAQGFDAVDPDKASVFALRSEWQHEEDDVYRIENGYQ